ncbi:putative peptidase C1-like protein [Symbiodinium microadriaticum]|uniref:Putative peptidase C1-like protein n=1 Tax=Symbiodinium microadriaticum TaxID=2951 RepID=A0A1Q9EMC0_SYMMI|nr:putative peptidase C1-like protein [Symbiodinium microadriaticum]
MGVLPVLLLPLLLVLMLKTAGGRYWCLCRNTWILWQDFADFTPSRLFIYYNERLVEGSVNQDAGAMIRDGIKTMSKVGVCPESVWKYDDGPDFFKQQPDSRSYEIAQKCKVIGYARVAQDLSQMKMCLKNGYPFVFGFAVLSSFQTEEVARTGKMVMPQANDQQLGGHAVCAVGYDDFQQCFIVRNSWGEEQPGSFQHSFPWGDKGYFYMPYEYMCNPALASDFWAINWVEGFKNAATKDFKLSKWYPIQTTLLKPELLKQHCTMGACESAPVQAGEFKVERHPAMSGMESRLVQKFGWDGDEDGGGDGDGEEQGEELDVHGGFPIFDQGHLGSCTANALAAAFHFTLHKMEVENDKDFADFTPSRLFIYYNERLVEGSVNQDAGAMIRDGIKTMSKVGVCPESVWKYDDGPDFFKQQPDSRSYEIAQKCKVSGYARVAQDLSQMKMCIKSGYPFVFGFAVLSSFQTAEVASTGRMVMPQPTDQQLGGHAVCAVGYDDFQQCFIVRNSWGEGWGDKGYFYMPYEYICNPALAMDLWAINWVEGFKNAEDMPDHRDLHVTFPKVEAPTKTIKKKAEGQKELVDLRPMNGGFPIFDQGHLGSCTANALAAAFHFTLHKMEVENNKAWG